MIGKERLEKAEWSNKLKFGDCYLTVDEIVLLMLGILLHDIGMSPKINLNSEAGSILEEKEKIKRNLEVGRGNRDELKKKMKELNGKLEELKEKIRKKHHEISARFVKENEELRRILEKHGFLYTDALAEIARGHREDIMKIFEDYPSVGNVRTSLLAFLLQIADDMDIGFKRVEDLVEIRHELNYESLRHVLANLRAKGGRVGGEVIYHLNFEDVDFKSDEALERSVLKILVEWNGKIERKIERAKLYGGEVLRGWRSVLPAKVIFKVESMKYDFDLSKRFGVDRELFAKILSSDVYGNDWMYAFRELISNAFDVIKRRWIEDEDFGKPKISIDVVLDDDGYLITIEDNGIGMSRDEVEDYLLTVGKSFYRELREKGDKIVKKISPAGYFGIGFLSSFMLAMDDNQRFAGWIEIETKKMNCDAVSVEIVDPNLPLIIKRSKRDRIGTKVRIRGKKIEVKREFEYIKEIKEEEIVNSNKEIKKTNIVDEDLTFEILEFILKQNLGNIKFPFSRHIASSKFEKLDLEIPIEVKVNGVNIWNGVVKPESSVDGEKICEVKVEDNGGYYKLEIWKGYAGRIINVNGIRCHSKNKFLELLSCTSVDRRNVGWILNVEAENVKFVDLKKSELLISNEVVGELFRELGNKNINLDLYYLMVYSYELPNFGEFKKIGAENFVKNCLRFEDFYGKFVSLKEIEKMGKKPVIVDLPLFKGSIEELKKFLNQKRLYPLKDVIYDKFF